MYERPGRWWSTRIGRSRTLLATLTLVAGCAVSSTPAEPPGRPPERDLKPLLDSWVITDPQRVRQALDDCPVSEVAGVATVQVPLATLKALVGRRLDVPVVEVPLKDLQLVLRDRAEWQAWGRSWATR